MGQKRKPQKSADATRTGARPMGLFGWLWTVLFVSAGMFVTGVLVGRGTAPVRFDIEALQKELATLKARAIDAEVQRYKIDPKADGARMGIDFHEALRTPRPRTENLKPATSAGRKQSKPATLAGQKQSRPAAVKPATGLPAKTGKRSAAAGFARPMTLQVASLKERASADRIVDDLVRRGFPATVVVADVPGKGRWHRVRVGRFKDRADAALMMKKLAGIGKKAIMVAR